MELLPKHDIAKSDLPKFESIKAFKEQMAKDWINDEWVGHWMDYSNKDALHVLGLISVEMDWLFVGTDLDVDECFETAANTIFEKLEISWSLGL